MKMEDVGTMESPSVLNTDRDVESLAGSTPAASATDKRTIEGTVASFDAEDIYEKSLDDAIKMLQTAKQDNPGWDSYIVYYYDDELVILGTRLETDAEYADRKDREMRYAMAKKHKKEYEKKSKEEKERATYERLKKKFEP